MNKQIAKPSWFHSLKCLGYIFGLLLLSSCSAKEYEGEGYKNYPDMKTILDENFKAMINANESCQLIQNEDGKKDTGIIQTSQVDWNDWKNEMLKADINKETFNKQYKISAITDTLMGTLTYIYSSLKPENFTKQIVITSREFDNAITSIYVETHDEGFFTSSWSKIMFAFGRSLQIQHAVKRPFSKKKEMVKTLIIGQRG